MRLLLDTQIVIAVINARLDKISRKNRELLELQEAQFFTSIASLWETAIKNRLVKLPIAIALEDILQKLMNTGLQLLPIDHGHVLMFVEPEPKTRDPFDRLLLAQCEVEGLGFVTADRALVGHRLAANNE